MDSPYLTVAEVARYLRVDSSTVRRWCNDGDLPAVRAGRLLRVDRDELARFAARAGQEQSA